MAAREGWNFTYDAALFNGSRNWSDINATVLGGVSAGSGVNGTSASVGQWDIAFAVILAAITPLGVFGNAMVIAVILTERSMRTVANILFFNLALADLTFMLICSPILVLTWLKVELASFTCKLNYYLIYSTVAVSICSLVAICLFRCLAIWNPLKTAVILTRRNATMTSVAIWLFGLLVNGHTAVNMYWDETYRTCLEEAGNYWQVLGAFKFTVNFALPSVAVVVLSILIIVAMRRHAAMNVATAHVATDNSEGSARQTRKLIVLVGIVVLVFQICWAPSQIFAFLHNMEVAMRLPVSVFNFFSLLSFSNSALNPVIYNLASQDFRRAFRRMLRRCVCKKTWRKRRGNGNMSKTVTDSTLAMSDSRRKKDQYVDRVQENDPASVTLVLPITNG